MQVEQKQKIFIDEFKLLENDHGGEHGFLATSGHFWMHQVTSGCFFLNAFWLFSPPAVFGHFWLAALAGFDYFWLLLHALVLFVHLVRPIIFYIAQIGKHSENWPEKNGQNLSKMSKNGQKVQNGPNFYGKIFKDLQPIICDQGFPRPYMADHKIRAPK